MLVFTGKLRYQNTTFFKFIYAMTKQSPLSFLRQLEKNNNKIWFDEHRQNYEAARQEVEQLVADVINKTAKFDASVLAIEPRKAMLRMHRDMRFTKNKPPYHCAFRMALSLKPGKNLSAAYYLNYEPGNIFMGGGLVGTPNDIVKKVRQEIDHNWPEFEKILNQKDFKSLFEDLQKNDEVSLKRPPKGYSEENQAIEYIKLKDFIARRWVKDQDLPSDKLADEISEAFKAAKPFLEFVNRNI